VTFGARPEVRIGFRVKHLNVLRRNYGKLVFFFCKDVWYSELVIIVVTVINLWVTAILSGGNFTTHFTFTECSGMKGRYVIVPRNTHIHSCYD
jgi:hypothetical protein